MGVQESRRHYCRNLRCRAKLPEPVDNHRHAFCSRGCFDRFYLGRCRVCERDISTDPLSGRRRSQSAHRQFCGRKCRAEHRKFPRVYAGGLPEPVRRTASVRNAQSTGIKFGVSGSPPKARCLRDWWWGDPRIGDLCLHDKDGLTIARFVLGADGLYHLWTPTRWPRMSSPDLVQAKHRAESLALAAIPLETVDPKLAARIKRDNATPHPMGPPLNRPWPIGLQDDEVHLGANSRIATADFAKTADPGPTPDFLQRKLRQD